MGAFISFADNNFMYELFYKNTCVIQPGITWNVISLYLMDSIRYYKGNHDEVFNLKALLHKEFATYNAKLLLILIL